MKFFVLVLFHFIFCLLILNCFANPNYREIYPDFELSLSNHGWNQKWADLYRLKENTRSSTSLVHLKNKINFLYETDRTQGSQHSKIEKIPKKIHQIWLGSPVPEKYEHWISTWKEWEGWDYHLWTDRDVEKLCLYNSQEFQESQNFGEKADILRYEILYQFGGLYIDIDFECLNPNFFKFAIEEYTYFSGIDPLDICEFRCENALLASIAGHPFIKQLIKGIKDNKHKRGVLNKTGPNYLTQQINKYWDLLEGAMIFPSSFFYPISNNHISKEQLPSFCYPETAAVHYFEGSWIQALKR